MYSWFQRSIRRPRRTPVSSATDRGDKNKAKQEEHDDSELYGITDQLIEFVKSFTLDTFTSFPFPDEDEGSTTTSGNVRKDLSDWQERHATLVLSKVKELSQLRFRLCPRRLKERQFWRIYFAIVNSYVAEYELNAIQLAKLKQMTMENENSSCRIACEVEMSETKHTSVATSLGHDSDSAV